jgi:hypothetical protein
MLSLNAYFDKYLEIIATSNDFTIQHVFIDENTVMNDLPSMILLSIMLPLNISVDTLFGKSVNT